MEITAFISESLQEDLGDGDHTSLACISPSILGKVKLLIKEDCVIAGVELAEKILHHISPEIAFLPFKKDGDHVLKGEIAFTAEGKVLDLLKAERLLLNCMQRMSGIATVTAKMADAIKGTKAKVLDTRKTTPNFRFFEKWAVKIGGGENHRYGLYDMILVKDNHIDFAGGIRNAILAVGHYLQEKDKKLRVEVEARTIEDVKEIISAGGIHRIMLDNFSIEQTREAVKLIAGRYEVETSGNITYENIRQYAECGVDYISVGALTHSYKSVDLSLKAVK